MTIKLDVRPTGAMVTSPGGLLIHDRASGEALPNQVGGELTYGVDQLPRLTVTLTVDGFDIAMGDNTERHATAQQEEAAKADAAMEEAHAANDLQAVASAFSGLTPANRQRFLAMYDLTDAPAFAEVDAASGRASYPAFVSAEVDEGGEPASIVVKLHEHRPPDRFFAHPDPRTLPWRNFIETCAAFHPGDYVAGARLRKGPANGLKLMVATARDLLRRR